MGMDMTGLEKIIEQIDRDAHAGASEVLAQADAECARILEAAQAESDRIRPRQRRMAKNRLSLFMWDIVPFSSV